MSIRAFIFFLFLIACMFSNSMQAGSEESIEALPSSPSSSPKQQHSPVTAAAAAENVMPTTAKKLPPRYARKIPKHIDEKPITLKHKQMLSVHDKTEQERANFEAKRAKDVKKNRKMNRTKPDLYTPYMRNRH